MRKFNINVNGRAYSVEVEEVGGEATTQTIIPVSTPTVAPVAPVSKAVGVGKQVVAPMPGLVKKLNFSDGATVKEGDTIIILEAMKMDTPVVASTSGVITYSTSSGSNVDTGAVLCTIA